MRIIEKIGIRKSKEKPKKTELPPVPGPTKDQFDLAEESRGKIKNENPWVTKSVPPTEYDGVRRANGWD